MDYCERCNGLAQPPRCRCCRQILGRRYMPKRNLNIRARSCKCSYPPQQPSAVSSSEIQKLLDQCMRLLPDHSSPRVKAEVEERVECILCGKTLKSKHGLQTHKSRYHRELKGTDGSSCDLCPRIFKSKRCLAIHMTKKHKKIDDGQ